MATTTIVKATDELSNRARSDRSIQSGRVLIKDDVTHSAILDVGMVDNNGQPQYLESVPFSPQNPPQPNDVVPILRTNSSAYSMGIGGGAQVGGANSGQVVRNGGVSSLAKSGAAKIVDDVTLTATGGNTLNESGQNIEIEGPLPTGGTSGQALTKASSTDYDVTWTDVSGAGGAPTGAHYLTNQAESGLSAEVNLGALTTGLLKHSVAAGISTPATAVAGTDYYNPGGTDVAVTDGGTGASTASDARTNLGLAIGTDVQAHDADLDTIAALTPTTDNFLQSKSSAWASRTPAQVAVDLQGTTGTTLAAGNDARFTTVTGNNQTGATYTFVLTDAGKVVEGNNASAIAFTVPPVSSVVWPVGTVIEVFQQGAGQITITAGVGVTLRSDGSKVKTAAQYATIGLRMRANDEWVISGDTV